jgi:phosphoribosyl-ATP pyrophosphohydrolase
MRVFEKKKEIIEHCASTNTEEFNFNKTLEEIAEFQEVMTKLKTKHPDNPTKPKKEELVKEFGDLIYRGIVYLKQQFPDMSVLELIDKVEARIEKKLSNLEEWRKADLYKSGL